MNMIKGSEGSMRFVGVSTEQDYVKIAQTAKHAGCTIAASDFLTNIKVSGTREQMSDFMKEYNNG